MAEPGDTLENIASDELARILKVTEVLKGIPDNAMRKARQEKMLAQIDDEMEMRRAAVLRRLKTSSKLQVQLDRAAMDERRPNFGWPGVVRLMRCPCRRFCCMTASYIPPYCFSIALIYYYIAFI